MSAISNSIGTFDSGEQIVRYYGYYASAELVEVSNRNRGEKKEDRADIIPHTIEGSKLSPAQRKAWVRLIQKIGACPKKIGKSDL